MTRDAGVPAAHLVVTAVGRDRPGIVAELTAAVAACRANVADSRMALLGGEFALMMLITGAPEALEALPAELETAAARMELRLIVRPTAPPAPRPGRAACDIRVRDLDHPGIVHAVTALVGACQGNILTLETAAYEGSVTGAPLFEMRLRADFPPEMTAGALREALAGLPEIAGAEVTVQPA